MRALARAAGFDDQGSQPSAWMEDANGEWWAVDEFGEPQRMAYMFDTDNDALADLDAEVQGALAALGYPMPDAGS